MVVHQEVAQGKLMCLIITFNYLLFGVVVLLQILNLAKAISLQQISYTLRLFMM